MDDPRCPSVEPDEVDDIAITVYLLKPQERVHGLEELDPAALRRARRRQKAAAARCCCRASPASRRQRSRSTLTKRKAHIRPDEAVKMYRFEAEVLK